jgi:hypothetical protein
MRQSWPVVASGKFQTEKFSDNGTALEGGVAKLGISMILSSMQSPLVQQVIGKKAENLCGPLVMRCYDDLSLPDKCVNMETQLNIIPVGGSN